MSLKDRLAKKTGDLIVPATGKGESSPAGSAPRTAPGQMLAFRSAMRENADRVTELEAQLKAFADSTPSRKLDPAKIRASKWANRHDSSFRDDDFEELRQLIAQTDGNTQPIKVRPVNDGEFEYEIVFGHRRHRACLELGLPVLALVDDSLSEQQQFVEMDQENRARKNLSAWEQGVWYKKALTEGLWPSQNAMAKACGLSQGNISSALLVADLPEEVVRAFASPHEIQFSVARKIAGAYKDAPDAVLRRARDISANEQLSAAAVCARLISPDADEVSPAVQRTGGDAVRVIKKGQFVDFRIRTDDLSAAQVDELKAVIFSFIGSVKGR